MRLLLEASASLGKCRDEDMWTTPLLEACRSGSLEIARWLVEAGADLEAEGTQFLPLSVHEEFYREPWEDPEPRQEIFPASDPPLHVAVGEKYWEIAYLLLRAGAKPQGLFRWLSKRRYKRRMRRLVLPLARAPRAKKIIRRLIRKRASTQEQERKGSTSSGVL